MADRPRMAGFVVGCNGRGFGFGQDHVDLSLQTFEVEENLEGCEYSCIIF